MTAMLSIVLAGAAVTPAAPIAANTWFTSQDNPKTAMSVAQRGGLAYAIDVAPDGTAIRCTPRGSDDLDRKVCELVMRNARFQPALDDRGQPAFALYDGMASFLMPGKNARPDRARLAIAVESLPSGVTGPAYARVGFTVDADGVIGNCTTIAGERRRFMQTVDALGPTACEHLATNYRPTPAHNAAGDAVPSVQSLIVRFELRAGA